MLCWGHSVGTSVLDIELGFQILVWPYFESLYRMKIVPDCAIGMLVIRVPFELILFLGPPLDSQHTQPFTPKFLCVVKPQPGLLKTNNC